MRRFDDPNRRIVTVAVNDESTVEDPPVTITFNKGAFKLSYMPVGPLVADEDTAVDGTFLWLLGAETPRPLDVGDQLVIVDYAAFEALQSTHQVKIPRPGVDQTLAPKPSCEPSDFANDPDSHRWCCIPHTAREAETADYFAAERAAGRMNPQTWPPLTDIDAFEIAVPNAPTAHDVTPDPEGFADDGLTIDDLD